MDVSKLFRAGCLGLALCAGAQAGAEEFALESLCTDPPRVLPLADLGEEHMDLTGRGQFLSFGEAALVCIGERKIYVDAGEQRVIDCEDVESSPDHGLGHRFEAGGKAYRLWFFIDTDLIPTRLEIGLYEAAGRGQQYYWIETGQKICAKAP